MTSIPVNNTKSVVMDFVAKTPEKTQKTGESGNFTDVLSKQTKENRANQTTEGTQSESEPVTKTQAKVSSSARDRMKQEEISDVQKADADKTVEEVADVLEKVEEMLVSEIAKELGISEEEVLEAMEILGLTAVDLLQPENLTMVVMHSSGETDPMVLVTNAELGEALKNLNQFVQNLKNELQTNFKISEEQLEAMLNQAQTESRGIEQNVQMETDKEADAQDGQPQIIVENFADDVTTVQTEEIKATDEESVNQMTIKTQSRTSEVSVTENVDQGNGQETKGQDEKGQNTTSNQNVFLQNLNQNTAPSNVAKADAIPFAAQQTTEIMNQIMDYMKIQIKPEMTQLEMQLHPESLGNVNVHIASKEGVITAQFTAQNETVKAAIESQIIQLKETFVEQGVKVEAIEVSVQANGFRQEYEGSKERENMAENGKKSNATRRINLMNPDLLAEETLSEEEQLAVSMMEANGNTVDYTV